jgi:hypothetical protein
MRLITSNVAASGTTSVDIVKYKTGGFYINNNETNAAAFTAFQVGTTEGMRITSGGNVGIGVNPTAKLQVYNGYAGFQYNSAGTYPTYNVYFSSIGHNFDNGGAHMDLWNNVGGGFQWHIQTGAAAQTTVMTIDSSGNLLVGTTSNYTANCRTFIKGVSASGSDQALVVGNSSGTYMFVARNDGYVALPSVYSITNAAAANVYIDSSGYLYRSTSSLKYKRDVEDAAHGLAEVMQLRPVVYKGNSKENGETIFGGLIAEEVHAVGLTEFVQYAEDGSPDALAYGNMVSLCIKAIQELSAKNDALEARLAKLETVQ